MPKILTHQREQALKMRIQERLSLSEIQEKLGVSRGSLSTWLRGHPLSKEELFKKRPEANRRQPAIVPGASSRLWGLCPNPTLLTPSEKGRIAEAAVLLRLTILGITPYRSLFEGGRYDVVAQHPSQEHLTFQVRWARRGSHGAPFLSLQRSHGRGKSQRYALGDFDYLVGYDLHEDVAYVFTWSEVESRNHTISLHPQAAEAWDKVWMRIPRTPRAGIEPASPERQSRRMNHYPNTAE